MDLETLLSKSSIYLNKEAQITFLPTKKVIIIYKYHDSRDIFLGKKVFILLKQTNFNKHAIKLEDSK